MAYGKTGLDRQREADPPTDAGGYGFPVWLWRALDRHQPAVRLRRRWRSPLRGPWLTSVFGAVLLIGLPIVIITGLLSYIAYAPQFGQALPAHVGWLKLPTFDWPSHPAWLYGLTQGAHVGLGLVLVPVVIAKMWSVIPRLFTWPPARSIAQVLERISLLMLIGGILFEVATGLLFIQYDFLFWFPWHTAHYFGAWVFIAGFLMHTTLKTPKMVRGLRSMSMRTVLRTNATDTRPEPRDVEGLVPAYPKPATMSRRGALALVGGGALGVAVLTAGQTIGGLPRQTALFLPRGRTHDDGPNDFPINKTAVAAGVDPATTGAAWRLPSPAGPHQSCSTALRWPPCRSTPRGCRSAASKAGPRSRPGVGSDWPTWPLRPVCQHRFRPGCNLCRRSPTTGSGTTATPCCNPTRCSIRMHYWRFG